MITDLRKLKPGLSMLRTLRGRWREHPTYQGCVGHWLMNEGGGLTVYDLSGTGNHGTIVANPAWIVGKFGYALSLNGSSQYVSVADSPSLDPGQITLVAWIKLSVRAAYYRIIDKAYSAGYALHTEQSTGKITMRVNSQTAYSSQAVDDNVWHRVVGVYNGVNTLTYVDGLLAGSGGSAGMTANAHPFTIGANQSTAPNSEWWPGQLDDVRAYNRAWTAQEVLSDYRDTLLPFRWAFEQRAVFYSIPAIVGSAANIYYRQLA